MMGMRIYCWRHSLGKPLEVRLIAAIVCPWRIQSLSRYRPSKWDQHRVIQHRRLLVALSEIHGIHICLSA